MIKKYNLLTSANTKKLLMYLFISGFALTAITLTAIVFAIVLLSIFNIATISLSFVACVTFISVFINFITLIILNKFNSYKDEDEELNN